MSRQPQQATTDGTVYLQLRVPGWLKNKIIERADELGVSVNSCLLIATKKWLEDEGTLPEPPVACNTLPTTADQIRAWATGQKLTGPCGQTDCKALDESGRWQSDGMGFCRHCGIRVQ